MWGGGRPAPDLMQWKGGGHMLGPAGGRVNSSQIITIAVFFEVFASKTLQWYFASLAVDKKRIILKAACWRHTVISIFHPRVGGTQLETESFTAPNMLGGCGSGARARVSLMAVAGSNQHCGDLSPSPPHHSSHTGLQTAVLHSRGGRGESECIL